MFIKCLLLACVGELDAPWGSSLCVNVGFLHFSPVTTQPSNLVPLQVQTERNSMSMTMLVPHTRLYWVFCQGGGAMSLSCIQFSHSVVSNSLRSHGLQHTRLPCPSPTPRTSQTHAHSIKSVMLFNHLILCRPLLLLPSISPSIRVSSSESVLRIRWPKYWSFSFSISPSNVTNN